MKSIIYSLIIGCQILVCSGSYAQLSFEWQSINENVHICIIEPYHNKSIVVEFENFLTLIEIPQNDTIASQLIASCKNKFPNKPIRYITHSHHHAHSIGSIDPLILTGAKLITSPFNLSEIKKLSKDTIRLLNNTLLLEQGKEYVIKDVLNEMHVFYAEQSQYQIPTKEYIISYLPKYKILVSGCLYNKPLTYHEVVNFRKGALKKIIEEKQIEIQALIPTNTSQADGFENICSMDMLEETLIKGIKPLEVAEYLQSKSIEYLESNLDSLTAWFSAKTPRSFDVLVCGNTLLNVKKDSDRASVLFKICTTLWPSEYEPYYYLGECYNKKGSVAETIACWEKAKSLAKNQDDKEEIQGYIDKIKQ